MAILSTSSGSGLGALNRGDVVDTDASDERNGLGGGGGRSDGAGGGGGESDGGGGSGGRLESGGEDGTAFGETGDGVACPWPSSRPGLPFSMGLVNGSLPSRFLLMLATLPERATPDAGECALSCLGEAASATVPVAVAGTRGAPVVDVDAVDVADVLLAVVSARVERGAREPTGLSVCAPLGRWLFDWDGGGEIGGIGRAPTRGSLI